MDTPQRHRLQFFLKQDADGLGFFERHPTLRAAGILVAGILILSVGGAFIGMQLDNPPTTAGTATSSRPTPIPVATADAFPSPSETVTKIKRIRGKDGSVSTATVLSYITGPSGAPQLIRETISESEPGVRVTATSTSTVIGPGSTVTAPGATSTAFQTIFGTVTVPGPETTVTQTETVTETVPGPGSTETVTVPGPTVTETVTDPS